MFRDKGLVGAKNDQKSIGRYSEGFADDSKVAKHFVGRDAVFGAQIQHPFENSTDVISNFDA
jgi:hypothetical protein